MISNRFKNNKSQVTLFLIFAIVMLVVLFILLFISSDTSVLHLFLKETKHPVEYYIEESMKFIIVDAVEILSTQGGFIYSYVPNLTTERNNFGYSVIFNATLNQLQNTSPSVEFMENEIAAYLENNIDSWIDNSSFVLNMTDEPKAEVVIMPEGVYAELYYPMDYITQDRAYHFSEFNQKQLIPLGRMIELRDTIVKDLLDYPNLMLLDKLYGTDFEMYINPYSGKIKVIDMVNKSTRIRNNPLTFSFAIQDQHSLRETLSFTQSMPDVTLNPGTNIYTKLKCNHACKFYDNTVLFEIGESTGIINYTADRLDIGEYNITLTIYDGIFHVDKVFNMKVEA